MKPLLALAFLTLTSTAVLAQDARFVAPQTERVPEEREIAPRAPSRFGGVFAQIFRISQPLQLLNPFAPSYYGSGAANVSRDESFGQSYPSQPALTVLSVEFE